MQLTLYLITLLDKLDAKQSSIMGLKERIETLYIYEASARMPFTSFVAWLQLELYRKNFEGAEDLINQYIVRSTHLADPAPQRRLRANDNEGNSDPASSNESIEEEKVDDGLNPA